MVTGGSLLGLTARLRQAGSMMYKCQHKRDPGLACSQVVGPLTTFLSAHISATRRDNRLVDSQARDAPANIVHRIIRSWPSAKPRRERPSHVAARWLPARSDKSPPPGQERRAGKGPHKY